ncbi:hypothetical protein BAMA_09485 [Bacillus manliponensis]|uniref:Uncharacterized protein n=1 Tax=Bacillus manliponensis TaxID=574376 RepID=A0A073K3H4_9BACI|nr:hypothetical protein BAMA_09485 [Bacillus manliponensis]
MYGWVPNILHFGVSLYPYLYTFHWSSKPLSQCGVGRTEKCSYFIRHTVEKEGDRYSTVWLNTLWHFKKGFMAFSK